MSGEALRAEPRPPAAGARGIALRLALPGAQV